MCFGHFFGVSYAFELPYVQNSICFSPVNLSYVSLIIRSAKELERKEGKVFFFPLYINHFHYKLGVNFLCFFYPLGSWINWDCTPDNLVFVLSWGGSTGAKWYAIYSWKKITKRNNFCWMSCCCVLCKVGRKWVMNEFPVRPQEFVGVPQHTQHHGDVLKMVRANWFKSCLSWGGQNSLIFFFLK